MAGGQWLVAARQWLTNQGRVVSGVGSSHTQSGEGSDHKPAPCSRDRRRSELQDSPQLRHVGVAALRAAECYELRSDTRHGKHGHAVDDLVRSCHLGERAHKRHLHMGTKRPLGNRARERVLRFAAATPCRILHLCPGPVGARSIVALHLQAKQMADQKVSRLVVVLPPAEAGENRRPL